MSASKHLAVLLQINSHVLNCARWILIDDVVRLGVEYAYDHVMGIGVDDELGVLSRQVAASDRSDVMLAHGNLRIARSNRRPFRSNRVHRGRSANWRHRSNRWRARVRHCCSVMMIGIAVKRLE